MHEVTCESIRKSIIFEESGEKFSVEVSLENLSCESKKETIVPFLDTLFQLDIFDFHKNCSFLYILGFGRSL